MKIQRLFLRNVRNIKSLDLDFRDPLTGKSMSRIVLVGANGTGKTTILESIFELLSAAAKYDASNATIPSFFLKSELRIIFEVNYPDTASVELSVAYGETSGILNDLGEIAKNIVEVRPSSLHFIGPRVDARKEKSDNSRWSELDELIQKASFGEGVALGAILFFPHDRFLSIIQQGQRSIESEHTFYQWAYKYKANDEWNGSTESYLVWLNYLDLQDYRDRNITANRFGQAVELVNKILVGKRITHVEKLQVIVETDKGETHGLGDLSSGEKQILLLLTEILRRIVPGSILLIDEPEISLHMAWQRGLVAALDKIIEQYDAQVILATHSVEIGTMVLPYEVISLNDLGMPLGKWEPEKEVLPK